MNQVFEKFTSSLSETSHLPWTRWQAP